MSRMVSFFLLIAIIVVLGVLFYKVMAAFLVPLFFAGLLVVMFRPLHRWICGKTEHLRQVRFCRESRSRQRLAAFCTTLAIMLIVLLPGVLITTLAVIEGSALVKSQNINSIVRQIGQLREGSIFEMPYAKELTAIESQFDALLAQENRLPVAEGRAVLEDMLARIEQLTRQMKREGDRSPQASTSYLREAIQAAIREAEAAGGKPIAAAIEYRQAVDHAQREFRDMKLILLDGPYLAWGKELVNEKVPEWINRGSREAQSFLVSVGGATTAFVAKLLVGLAIMVIAVYFFFLDGPAMVQTVMRLSPLDDNYERELLDEFDSISRAVVIATLLSAVVQGLLAGFGFWLAGLQSIFLLILLTTSLALVPFVGAAAVWIPASLWLHFYEDRTLAAVLLAIYGATVISMADNVIKPYVLHGQSRLHPLLALLSVLGGVQALGPIGILVGPMVVVFLQALLNILQREMTSME